MSIALTAILAGKKLGNAIKSHGKAIATYKERDHLLAVSAIAHHNEHGGTEYVQALYDMAPVNHRGALKAYFVEFGRFTVETDKALKVTFKFSKGKAGNLDGAMKIAPADFVKEAKEGGNAPAGEYDFVKPFTTFKDRATALLDTFEKENVPMDVVQAMEALQAAIVKAETKAAQYRVNAAKNKPAIVVNNDKPATAKPAKAKAAKPATKTEPAKEAAQETVAA